MDFTSGKISNYIGQAKKDDKKALDNHLVNIDLDLQNIWRLINSNLIYIGNSKATLATNTTVGFSYVPIMSANPTGTPTAYTGHNAIVYSTSNSSLYIYNTSDTAWKII